MNDDDDLLEQRLQDAFRVAPSQTLKDRLLAIPDTVAQLQPEPDEPRGIAGRLAAWFGTFDWRLAVPATAVAAAIAIVWAAGLQLGSQNGTQPDEATLIAQREAIRDFVIVMEYLNDSTARANAAVQGELGAGLLLAFERGEQSFKDTSNRVTNGG